VIVKAMIVARSLRLSVAELIVPRSSDALAVASALKRAVRRRLAPSAAAA
jgi:hypothetical protein